MPMTRLALCLGKNKEGVKTCCPKGNSWSRFKYAKQGSHYNVQCMWAGDWVNLLLSAQLAQATQWIWTQLVFEEIALGSHSLPQASDSNLDDISKLNWQ